MKNYTPEDGKSLTLAAARTFEDELSHLSEHMREGEFDQFLQHELIPILNKAGTVYGTSVIKKLYLALQLSQSELENRGLPMELAIQRMNVKAACWMLDHIWTMQGALDILKYVEKGYPIDDCQDRKMYIEAMEGDLGQIAEWMRSDMYERLQDYEREIKNGA